jgi:MYXO-CTERM domain-containing protein
VRLRTTACVLALLVPAEGLARDLWVSTDGSAGGDGTRAMPFNTLQVALRQAQPGDRVLVRAGVYPGGGWIDARGTAEAPITVVSANGRHRAVLEGGREALRIGDGAAYLVFDGLEVRGSGDNVIHIDGDAHHITLRNVFAHDAGPNGDVLKVNQASFITVERSEFARPGPRPGSTENPYQECIDFLAVDNLVLRDSYIHDGGGNLVYAKGGSRTVVFERNVIANQRAGAADPMVGLGAVTDRQLIANGGAYEIYDAVFRNNLVVGGREGGLAVYDGRNVNIVNNLFVDNDRVLVEFRAGNGSAGGSNGVRVVNNVFVDTRGQMPEVLRRPSHTLEALSLSHNLFWNAGRPLPPTSLLDVPAQPGHLLADPRVTLTQGDRQALVRGLRPAMGSAAETPGLDVSGEPYELRDDLFGLPRAGRWDRGPYNLSQPIPPIEPEPPPLFPFDDTTPDAGPSMPPGPAADMGGCAVAPGPPAGPGRLVGALALALAALARVARRRRG